MQKIRYERVLLKAGSYLGASDGPMHLFKLITDKY